MLPRCFNEAEAIKPRNHTVASCRHRDAGPEASMRPRQSSLGILKSQQQDTASRPSPGFNEAEAIKPRNPVRRRREIATLDAASMRPRQSSLGISAQVKTVALHCMCFNEAEAIKPRNPSECRWLGGPHVCFNEAEAIKPRNRCRRTPGRRLTTCFNEAEAIKPRNPKPSGQAAPASSCFNEAEAIKPRNRSTQCTSCPSISIGCFNEAEAIKPRNRRPPRPRQ